MLTRSLVVYIYKYYGDLIFYEIYLQNDRRVCRYGDSYNAWKNHA